MVIWTASFTLSLLPVLDIGKYVTDVSLSVHYSILLDDKPCSKNLLKMSSEETVSNEF